MSAWLPRLIRAWLLTALIDGLFSSVLVSVFYGSSVARLWQGVAAVPLGASALQGGSRTVLIGLALHLAVALTWSAIFLILYSGSGWLRGLASSPGGVAGAAVIYGPLIWMAMSLILIPQFTHRPATINYRWWVQWFGHIPFVALPIVTSIARQAPVRIGSKATTTSHGQQALRTDEESPA